MKYGRDQNKNMKRPDNEQPDEEVDELANLAGKFFKDSPEGNSDPEFRSSILCGRYFRLQPVGENDKI